MSDIVLMLRLEHRNMERVLACFETRVDTLAAGGPLDRLFLGSIVEYFLTFPDRAHHPKENLLHALLARRHPPSAAAVGDLRKEHAGQARDAHRLALRLDDAYFGQAEARQRFVEAARAFTRAQLRHIEMEESLFFPASLRHLGADEWDNIDFAVFDDPDPLFRVDAEAQFRALQAAILSGEEHAG